MAGAESVPVIRDQCSSSQSDNYEFLQAPVQEQGTYIIVVYVSPSNYLLHDTFASVIYRSL